MSEKWTQEERSAAESYAWGCQTGGKRPVTLLEVELACQRNRALVALKAALDLFAEGHAIDRFDWGKSFLQADNIRELNELPGQLRAAIATCEGKL